MSMFGCVLLSIRRRSRSSAYDLTPPIHSDIQKNGEVFTMRNSHKTFVALALLAAMGVATTFGQAGHGYDLASLDKNASACTDFYQYANGGWLAANPIPPAYPSWGVANILDEKNKDVLHDILEAAAKNTSAPKGSSEQKVGDYYATCMDE